MKPTPFHLAIQVRDIDESRDFYGGKLGFPEGRSAETWIDFNMFGHQFVTHLNPQIGKTGTAQVVGLEHHEEYENEEDIPKEIRDHAWFVAGVLDRSPRLAICVLVEHGLHGSSTAAPIAKQVIEHYYASLGEAPLNLAMQEGSTP